MIELKDIDVVFKQKDNVVTAVKDVNLSINRGEIFGIVGYSGAGKSTLVRTINLLQRPTHGSVIVNGQNLIELAPAELRTARKKIGMIFQHFNLMNSRTIFDNVAFPLKGSGLSKKEVAHKVAELLNLVGLKEKSDSYPSQLSGGQKQRVAIARALANDPDVLLCDEATSALDPKTTSSILKLLKELNQKLNITMVVITHEMAVVKDLCDRVAVMENGHVLEEGSILEIFTQPKQSLTKEFINTATHFDQEIELVLKHPQTISISHESELARLTYTGDQTTQPFITEVIREYGIEINILYGHIEIIQNTPVGNLLVALKGEPQQINAATEFLKQNSVKVDSVQTLFQQYVQKEADEA
ncbi:MAG TPA: methionine ABC transporter ATP-binding protein [Globicatella sulfidifaciens]|uniref:D-methionine transport system ATP-binding protein n=2 Tax=Globicatella sulfidifaciens TaxID=136093 RepID=A0A1T4JUW1_9LACT|nr:methionine ABC transporter ATP-binding protein [Globicatella sulfidifaciens]NLJ18557.1 methionine ABC transporter ATP-binding protein [Globicatella sulfidifaciens]SJZ33956.1 D-methionine transport system ATP-binding protein [Globicatella sulfidifaciens DSM 15739]HJF16010.1 methionine ABC transporter ATP-binding protein [Globicatella sulfidifaciens]